MIAVNGYFESYRTVGVVGLIIAVAPLILRGIVTDAAAWSLVVVGAASALLAGYQVLFVERGSPDRRGQQRAA